ncbi:MAG: AEC family transporter [Parasporobacterium sp.]|nr:AEC family transporter [Parasporobacterium sp.]
MTAMTVTMLKIIAAMALGFLLYKIHILNDTANKGLSGLIVHATSPCMVFTSIISMDGSEIPNAITILWIGVVIYVVLIILAFLIVRIMKIPAASSGVYQAAIIFGNVGFLGLPLAESLFGPVGLFYMAILNIHMNLFVYSYGFFIIARNSSSGFKFSAKTMINAGIISVIIAMIIFFLQIPLPEYITSPISFIGGITSPLAMIVIGSTAAAHSLKTVFSHKKLYILSAIKLLIIPAITYFILKLTLGNGLMTQVITMYIGMPTAALVSMIAIAYDSDAEIASSATAMMNIFCILTIPLLYIMMAYL